MRSDSTWRIPIMVVQTSRGIGVDSEIFPMPPNRQLVLAIHEIVFSVHNFPLKNPRFMGNIAYRARRAKANTTPHKAACKAINR